MKYRNQVNSEGNVSLSVAPGDEFTRWRGLNLRRIISGGVVLVFSAVMCATPFTLDSYPFGIAVLCAVEGWVSLLCSLVGIGIGSLFVNGGVRFLACACAICAVRCAFSQISIQRRQKKSLTDTVCTDFAEGENIRAAISSAGAILVGTAEMLVRQNLYRSMAGMIVCAFLCPILVLGYIGYYRRKESRIRMGGFILALLFSLSFALRGISLFGISPAAIFAMAVSLAASRILFIPEALCVSLSVSLALSPAVVPAVLCATAVSGLIMRYGAIASATVSLFVSVGISLASMGLEALSSYTTEFVIASVLFASLAQFNIIPGGKLAKSYEDMTRRESEELTASKKAVSNLADCFFSMGKLAKSVSGAMSRPNDAQLRECVTRAFDSSCASCPRQKNCREDSDGAVLRSVRHFGEAVKSGKRVSEGQADAGLRSRCAMLGQIAREVNREASLIRESYAQLDNSRLFAEDWETVGKMFSDVSDKLEVDNRYDAALSRRLKDMLGDRGVVAPFVSVRGERILRCTLSGIDPRTLHMGAGEIGKVAREALGVAVSEPAIAISGENVTVTMHADTKYKVSCARFTSSSKSRASGDVISVFSGDDGYFRALISDGMGSGTEAAFTAGTVALILERLLCAGVKMKVALSLANSFIRERRIECSATVDIMELDLIRGSCSFVKSGAAPSFVMRNGRLFKLKSRTVPIGILPSADAEKLDFRVEVGDIIIMMSDGVTQTEEDCPWLYDILSTKKISHLAVSAKEIADEASKVSEDDISVLLVRVEKK